MAERDFSEIVERALGLHMRDWIEAVAGEYEGQCLEAFRVFLN